jgi:hypothetical protein
MDEIERLERAERRHYESARRAFGPLLSIVQETTDLYELLGAAVRDSGVPLRDEVVAGVRYLAQCQYHVTAGSLTLARAHIRDSFGHLRQAIESCGFGAKIRREPALAKLWVNDASVDGPERKKVRTVFRPEELLPRSVAKLAVLEDRWNFASMMAHSSFLALAKSTTIEKVEGARSVQVKYFDLDEREPGQDLLRHLVYLVQTHLLILRAFEDVLPEAVEHLGATWTGRWKAVDDRLRMHADAVRPR